MNNCDKVCKEIYDKCIEMNLQYYFTLFEAASNPSQMVNECVYNMRKFVQKSLPTKYPCMYNDNMDTVSEMIYGVDEKFIRKSYNTQLVIPQGLFPEEMSFNHSTELLLEIIQYEWGDHLPHDADTNIHIEFEQHTENNYYHRVMDECVYPDKWINVVIINVVREFNRKPLSKKYKEKKY